LLFVVWTPVERVQTTKSGGDVKPEETERLAALISSDRKRMAATEAQLVVEHLAIVEASTDANIDDEHDPEGATIGFERAQVASLLSHVRRRLAELDETTERLRSGTHGTCYRCGEPIPYERLVAHPTAMVCVNCGERA